MTDDLPFDPEEPTIPLPLAPDEPSENDEPVIGDEPEEGGEG